MSINRKNLIFKISFFIFLSLIISSCKEVNTGSSVSSSNSASSYYLGSSLGFDTIDRECVVSEVLAEPLKNNRGYFCGKREITSFDSVKDLLEGMVVVSYSIEDGSEGTVNERCEPIVRVPNNVKILLKFSNKKEDDNKNINVNTNKSYECSWQL